MKYLYYVEHPCCRLTAWILDSATHVLSIGIPFFLFTCQKTQFNKFGVCVRKFHVSWLHVSWIRPMNWRRGYQTVTSPFFSRIWTRSGLIRGDPKFGQGLGYVAALQVKCLLVYGVSVTFMSTGYMCHGYDWMMILISTRNVAVLSPFNTKHMYRCVCVCVCVPIFCL